MTEQPKDLRGEAGNAAPRHEVKLSRVRAVAGGQKAIKLANVKGDRKQSAVRLTGVRTTVPSARDAVELNGVSRGRATESMELTDVREVGSADMRDRKGDTT